MSREYVWAINDKGKPERCYAKPENRGKRNCNHKFHQEKYQSDEAFFAEHYVNDGNILLSSPKIELSPYRISDEEKLHLKEIKTKKDLREPCDDGAYMNVGDQPLWNDMDKNYFSQTYDFNRKSIDCILREERFVALQDFEKYKEGDLLSEEDEQRLKNGEDLPAGTGLEAMNELASRKGFEATKDIYVIPYWMRPGVEWPPSSGQIIDSDITSLYHKIFTRRKYSSKSRQEAYENLLSSGNNASYNNSLKPLSELLKGKKGIFRKDLTGYSIPYAGRAVAVPNVDISYDQVKIPTSMAADIFKPTVMKNLDKHGFTEEEIHEVMRDAKRRTGQSSQSSRRLIERALQEENVRMIMIRNPSLHEASMESFTPKVGSTSCLEVNPLVCKGYGMDFDGDVGFCIGINSEIISSKADEAMHPSNFKNTPRHKDTLNFEPTKDAKWGLMNILKRRS